MSALCKKNRHIVSAMEVAATLPDMTSCGSDSCGSVDLWERPPVGAAASPRSVQRWSMISARIAARPPLPQQAPTAGSHSRLPQQAPTAGSHSRLPQQAPTAGSHSRLPQQAPTAGSHSRLPQQAPTASSHSELPCGRRLWRHGRSLSAGTVGATAPSRSVPRWSRRSVRIAARPPLPQGQRPGATALLPQEQPPRTPHTFR
jgi:hypothetical protein